MKMKFSFCLFLLLASWLVSLEAAAQHNFILSGKITARDGSAMPQVTVSVKGTTWVLIAMPTANTHCA